MAQWQSGAAGTNVFTAAGSPNLFGGSSTWCGSGCGQCYELTNLGALPAVNKGDCTGAGQTITVMITNLCPVNGNEEWCSVPDSYGFPAHFDIMSKGGPNGWSTNVLLSDEMLFANSGNRQPCRLIQTSDLPRVSGIGLRFLRVCFRSHV